MITALGEFGNGVIVGMSLGVGLSLLVAVLVHIRAAAENEFLRELADGKLSKRRGLVVRQQQTRPRIVARTEAAEAEIESRRDLERAEKGLPEL